MNKDLRKLLKAVEDQGFTARRTSGGHWQIRGTDGRVVAVIAGTPSDVRSWKNTIADLRRAGFEWPPPPRR